MSLLSRLLGNYADDITKAAAKTTAKTAGKTAGKVLASQADDITRAAGKSFANQVDDAARTIAKKTADIGADSASKASRLYDMADNATPELTGLKKASKASATQKLASKQQNEYANSFGNITRNTRQELYGKYRGGGTIGDRLSKANVDVANVADKSSMALDSLGKVQRGLYDYADQAGVSINLGDITKNSGLTKVQKSRINDILGLDLDGTLSGTMSASKAEELYRTLRNQASVLANSSDASQQLVGKNLQKVAKSISEKIDDSIEPLKGSYGLSQRTVQAMQEYGDDPSIIRAISKKGDNFSVADLRGEMQPWMVAQEGLVGNKLPAADTLKIAGVDTGLPNVVKGAVQGVGKIPLKAKAALEKNPALKDAALVGGGVVGGSLLNNLLSGGGSGVGIGGGSTLGGMTSPGAMTNMSTLGGNMPSGSSGAQSSNQATINGYTYDQLEQGYMAALQAGDPDAAKVIQEMMGMLDDKLARQEKYSGSSGVEAKQKKAMSVLNDIMQNLNAKGPIAGNLTQFFNMITGGSYDPQSFGVDATSRGSLGSIIKALGDTGALSEGDQKRALDMIPSTTDSPEGAQAKYQQLLQILYSAGTK